MSETRGTSVRRGWAAVLAILVGVTGSACGTQGEAGLSAGASRTTNLPDLSHGGRVDFDKYCAETLGGRIVRAQGGDLCQVTKEVFGSEPTREWTPSFFPRLSRANPDSDWAYDTGIRVQAKDRIVASLWGGWGEPSTAASDSGCRRYPLSGRGEDGSAGLSDGLVASVGDRVFAVGTEVDRVVTRAGELRIGFNVPAGQANCALVVAERFEVLHCEDSLGATVVCP
jgi:hypothetical protein